MISMKGDVEKIVGHRGWQMNNNNCNNIINNITIPHNNMLQHVIMRDIHHPHPFTTELQES